MRAPKLQGKVIVVVGSTTGIGLSAAKAFLAEDARIVGVGRNRESVFLAQKECGSNASFFSGDACRPKTAVKAIETALRRFGRFDGLYHVAGGSGRQWGDGPLHEITEEGWARTLELNLSSLFFSNRAAVRQFLKQRTGGAILNLGSVLGFSPSPQYFSTHAYATAKAAIMGLATATAAYYAQHQIRINVLAPALVETPMAKRAVQNPQIMKFIRKKQPLEGGRAGKADDLDAAAVFFLSDESRYVTGQVLAVDGGWSVSEGAR